MIWVSPTVSLLTILRANKMPQEWAEQLELVMHSTLFAMDLAFLKITSITISLGQICSRKDFLNVNL